MRLTQGSALDSLRGVQRFLDEQADKFGEVNKTGVRKDLDDLIATVSTHAVAQKNQDLSARGATRQAESLRTVLLKEHMAPIARIARANLPPTPAVEPLKLPRHRLPANKLAAYAEAMGQVAAQYEKVFTSAGLPPTFVADLKSASDAVVAAYGARTQARSAQVVATDGLKLDLKKGRQVVRILDSFVTKALKNDGHLLSGWKTLMRVKVVPPGRPAGSVVPTPSPVTTGASVPEPKVDAPAKVPEAQERAMVVQV